MTARRSEEDGLSRRALSELVSDMRTALDKLEGRLNLNPSIKDIKTVNPMLDSSDPTSEVLLKATSETHEIAKEVSSAVTLTDRTDHNAKNDRSTSEPYTRTHLISSELPGNFPEQNEPGRPSFADQRPSTEETALTSADVAPTGTIPSLPIAIPDGWEGFFKWFEILDKELGDSGSKEGNKGWALLWKRLKDRIFNDQNNPPDGWAKLWRRLRAIDEEKIRDYKEDIDSLLILSGLFSAIVTAFLIAFYVSLQPDSQDTTAFLVYQISLQLTSAFPIISQPLDATQLSLPSFPFQISAATIRINALWFTSLICALITASFGILVKQWLREYMAIGDMKPDAQCRVRYLREVNLYKWGVYHIASFLPLLLQGAIILFFVGLLDFARSLHPTLGGIVIAFVALYLLLFVGTTLAPIFSPHCPYRTPFLNTALQIPRYLLFKMWRLLYRLARSSEYLRKFPYRTLLLKLLVPTQYLQELERFPQHGFNAFRLVAGENRRLDVPFTIATNAVLQDDDLGPSFATCLDALHWEDAFESGPFADQHTQVQYFLDPRPPQKFIYDYPYSIHQGVLRSMSQFINGVLSATSFYMPHHLGNTLESYSKYSSIMATYRSHNGDLGVFKDLISPILRDMVTHDTLDTLVVIRILLRVSPYRIPAQTDWCSSLAAIDALMDALCSDALKVDVEDMTAYGLELMLYAAQSLSQTDRAVLKSSIWPKVIRLVSLRGSRTWGFVRTITRIQGSPWEDEVLADWCNSAEVIACVLNTLSLPEAAAYHPIGKNSSVAYYQAGGICRCLRTTQRAARLLLADDRWNLQARFPEIKTNLERAIQDRIKTRNMMRQDWDVIAQELDKLQEAVCSQPPTTPSPLSEDGDLPAHPAISLPRASSTHSSQS